MTLIAERTDAVNAIRQQILDHPMCGRLIEGSDMYRVIYPAGDFPVDGLQSVVRRGEGKAIALSKLLPVMDRHWLQSYPGGNGMNGNV